MFHDGWRSYENSSVVLDATCLAEFRQAGRGRQQRLKAVDLSPKEIAGNQHIQATKQRLATCLLTCSSSKAIFAQLGDAFALTQ